MGCCFSSKLSSSSSTTSNKTSSSNNNIVRVVHLNGSLEVYEDPITVGQVTGKQPKHFVFAQAQLLSLESKPLDQHAQLQLGNLYFLLPHSVFQSEVSPIDLATISRRLTQAARHGRCSTPAAKSKSLLLRSTTESPSRNYNSASPNRYADRKRRYAEATTAASPNRYADRKTRCAEATTAASPNRFSDRWRYDGSEPLHCAGGFNMQNQPTTCNQSPCWKPILESITERSLTRRSESDLQELDTAKLEIKAL